MEFGNMVATRCEKLQRPNYVNLAVSVIILVGLFVSYLPQHYRIASRRTSEGISPYFILLGTTSATASFANILALPASRADVACCKTVSSFECFAGLLGIAQVGSQWFCFSIILLLFLIFFPREPAIIEATPGRPTWRTALTVGFLCVFHGLVIISITGTLMISRPSLLLTWANILGIMAASLATIQYLPQIYTTFRLKHVGSLSIPMMLMQTPGGFLFAASLATRLGVEGWSTWGVFLVTGTLQGVLLSMGVYYELQIRRKAQQQNGNGSHSVFVRGNSIETDDEGNPVVESTNQNERTPLLKNKKGGSRT